MTEPGPVSTPGRTPLQKYGPIAAVLATGIGLTWYVSTARLPWWATALTLGMTAMGVYVAGLRKMIARWKLGPVEVDRRPHTLSGGHDLDYTVRFKPKSSGRLRDVEVELEAYHMEGSGNHRREVRDYIDRDSGLEEVDPSFAADEWKEVTGDLWFPEPDTQLSRSEWKLQVKVAVAWWPDWTRTYRLDPDYDASGVADSFGRNEETAPAREWTSTGSEPDSDTADTPPDADSDELPSSDVDW